MDNRIKIALAATLLSCSVAYAGDPAPATTPAADTMSKSLPSFSTLDVNGDGAISADEAKNQATLVVIFVDVDANKNGTLDSKEYADAQNRLQK